MKTVKKKTNNIRITKKQKGELTHLISCGTALSNIAFNLAQDKRAENWNPILKQGQKEWDEARIVCAPLLEKICS